MTKSTTYPLCHQFGLSFNAYEDRLILSTEWKHKEPMRVLLTRRMVILILQRLLAHLPELAGLHKTPRTYWQEALHIAHQQALRLREQNQQSPSTQTVDVVIPPSFNSDHLSLSKPLKHAKEVKQPSLYLATEVSTQHQNDQLLLGLTGLRLPDAMITTSPNEPVLALSLEIQHLHQLLQLFLAKATEAQWHLPVELPWTAENLVQDSVSH